MQPSNTEENNSMKVEKPDEQQRWKFLKPQTSKKLKHEIKIKQIKILSGFFPVFIFFEVLMNPQTKEIEQKISDELAFYKVKYESIIGKHITLTKTINILESQVKELNKKIERSLKNRINLPIVLLFKRVKILQNFVCLEVQKVTHLKLEKITEIIGETIKNPYFQNPIYHLSLFKITESISQEQKTKLENISLKTKTAMLLQNLYMNAGIKKIKLNLK